MLTPPPSTGETGVSDPSEGTLPIPGEDGQNSKEMPLIPIDHTLFKDVIGRYRTVSLFLELNDDKKYPSFYTLKERDYKGHTSLRRLYLEQRDLEEYTFAQKAFGSWDHWAKLQDNYWFKPILAEWRDELRKRIVSEQLKNLQGLTHRTDAIGLGAIRTLLAYASPTSTRGRPSKEEVAGALKKKVMDSGDTEADALRVGVVVPFNRIENEPKEQEANG